MMMYRHSCGPMVAISEASVGALESGVSEKRKCPDCMPFRRVDGEKRGKRLLGRENSGDESPKVKKSCQPQGERMLGVTATGARKMWCLDSEGKG